MPVSGAASTVRRTASAPARCPAMRGRPRMVAQRPLPSMMMAACSFLRKEVLCSVKSRAIKKSPSHLFLAHGFDEGLHVIQIPLERAPAGGGEPVLGLGKPVLKSLGA